MRRRRAPGGPPPIELGRWNIQIEGLAVHVEDDLVTLLDQGDGPAEGSLRCDMADHQAVGATREASIGQQRHGIAEAFADQRPGHAEHLLHSRATDGAFVANDDDVARLDLLRTNGVVAGSLGVEHPSGPSVMTPLMAGQLDNAAIGGQGAAQDRKSADRLEWPLDGHDDLLAGRLANRRGNLRNRATVDRRGVAVQEVALEQLAHDQRDAAGVVHVGGREPAPRRHVGDDRGPVGDLAELVDVERNPELMGDRQEVEDAVGRAARRGDRGNRIVDGRPRNDRGRPDVVTHEGHRQLAARSCGIVFGGILGRNTVEPSGRDAQEFEGRAHRVRGELSAAGSRAGTGRVLDLVQLFQADLPRPVCADGLEDRHDRGVPATLVEPRVDRSVVENHGRDVEAAERHHRGGNGLVAADEADETVEQVAPGHELDRVGDDLAADKGGLHPLGAHRDAVRDRDGVELHRRAATRTDAFLDETGEASLVQVAGHRLDPGGRDAHDRLGEVLVRKSDSLEHRPCASAIGPVRQRAAVALGRVGRAVVWQGPGSPSRRGLRAHRLSLGWSSVPAV